MKNTWLIIFSFLLSASVLAQTGKTTVKKTVKKTTTPKVTLPANTSVWTVDAQRATCEGVTTMQCLLVKKPGDKDFNLFYDNIEGFDYQEGFVYTIWVKQETKTPPIPADASIYRYVLVKIVSKKPIAGYSNTTTIHNSKPLSGMNVATTRTLVVNEEKVPCDGNPDAKCLLIKGEKQKEFEVFYQSIEGFQFEPGFRQTILVTERHIANPMVKEAEPIYTLVRVLKKERISQVVTDTAVAIATVKTPLDKKWFLRKMKDSDTSSYEIEDNAVYIEINSAERKLNGKAPCNNFFGGFKSEDTSFQTSAIASTKMYCNNMRMEDLFLTLLQNADRYEIKNNRLILYKGDRLLLEFE